MPIRNTLLEANVNVANQQIEFSEIEAIEFSRRVDLAFAVVPNALRIFAYKAELLKEEKSAVKTSNVVVYGCIAFGCCAFTLEWFLNGGNVRFGVGSILGLLSAVVMFFAIHMRDKKLEAISTRRSIDVAKLEELQLVWRSATACNTFHELSRFCNLIDGQDFKREDQGFCDWWLAQKERILVRLCGSEKVEKIAGTEAFEAEKVSVRSEESRRRLKK
jgi:hypothetical protein